MKVVHKGTVIVFAPLVIQIAMILNFRSALEAVQQQIDKTAHSRDIVALGDRFRRAIHREGIFVILNRISPSDDLRRRIDECVVEVDQSLAELEELTKGSRAEHQIVIVSRKQSALMLRVRKLIDGMPDGLTKLMISQSQQGAFAGPIQRVEQMASDLFKIQDQRANSLPSVIEPVSGQLLATLVIGTLFSLLAAVLGFHVAKEIGKRLTSLLSNAWRLVAGAPLMKPNLGDDEIALLEKTLYQSAEDLRSNEEFRQEIVGIVSHELRTPLTSLSATLTVLSSGSLGTLDKESESTLEKCSQAAAKVVSMISNLLDLEMIESGKLVPTNESANFAAAIRSAMFAIEDAARWKNISIVSTVDPDVSTIGDEAQIARLLEELLSCAIDHSRENSSIEIAIADEPACMKITYEGDAVAEAEDDKDGQEKDLPERLRWSLCNELARLNSKKLTAETISSDRQTLMLRLARKGDHVQSIRQVLPVAPSGRTGWFSFERKWQILLLPVLVSQCIFVGTMLVLSSQVRQELKNEYDAWKMLAQANKVTTSVSLMASSVVGIRMGPEIDNVSRRGYYQNYERQQLAGLKELLPEDTNERDKIEAALRTLLKLHNKSPLSQRDTGVGDNCMLTEEDFKNLALSMRTLVDTTDHLISKQVELRSHSKMKVAEGRRKIDNGITIALGFSLVTGLFLLVSLNSSMTGRINRLTDSSRRLATRSAMQPALDGDDEFAQIDRILHFIDQRFTQFESFKKETSMLMGQHLRHSLDTICIAIQNIMSTSTHDKQNVRLKNTMQDCQRLIRLVDDFLNARVMEAGKFDIHVHRASTREIIETATLSVEQLARKSGIVIEKPKDDFHLECDRDRIVQVLINFLSNAIKFSDRDSIVSIDAVKLDSAVEFQVTDRGRGIPHDGIDKLFHRYEQSEAKDWREKRGSGLGLYICKSIVDAHGGEIGVDSELGEGSTFWARIPSQSEFS